MKRLLLLMLALFFIGGTAFSQISFGPKAGILLAKYGKNYTNSEYEPNMAFRVGPSAGAVLDMPLCDHVSFQPSVMFSIKGSAENLSKGRPWHPNHTYEGYNRDRIFYFEMPINFAGKLELGPGVAQIFVGPYLAFAMTGRNYYDYTETAMDGSQTKEKGDVKINLTGTVTEEDYETDGLGHGVKPFDFGFDFGLGYHWKTFLFNLGYNLGIANLQPKDETIQDFDPKDFKFTNQGIFFNVAWLFSTE